jgi:hypothetical protein
MHWTNNQHLNNIDVHGTISKAKTANSGAWLESEGEGAQMQKVSRG